MADEFGAGGPNWWDSTISSRSRFETAASSGMTTSIGSFGWLADMAGDVKAARPPPLDQPSPNISISSSGSGGSSPGFHHHQHHDAHKLSLGGESNISSNLPETGSQMNLGLSSQSMDWNQQHPLLRPDNISSNNFQEENYTTMHGVLGFESRPVNNTYQSYAATTNSAGLARTDHHQDHQQLLQPNWSKVPQFLSVSSRKQPPQQQSHAATAGGQLHFSNIAAFWNASTAAATVTDVKPGFFPADQAQFPAPSFEKKSKNLLEMGDSSTGAKKSRGQMGDKRPRNESAQSPLPPFKVKKEKMGDRITALQQLVSPFGKTDTASVLSETIIYIKFLHEQVSVLITPYMKAGGIELHHHHHHRQNAENEKSKDDDAEDPWQDLRSRGLCLVPLESTFPITSHSSTNHDFWNSTFGGAFR
ncbi:hypothetical protein SAY86_010457 [Trapa natans]|uniref:BHLH domain-containing protein n=1 Tax=Trapa natans TaxID=22666 RepID=A0AAN7LKK3_TRANT|nr:hypothetical protein SAY86_010457 [Trapa natans]